MPETSGGSRSRAWLVWTLLIAALIYVPVLGYLEEKSERSHNGRSGYGRSNDLHQIGMAIESYVDDHDRMPSSLWDLYDQYIDNARTLASRGNLERDVGHGEWTLNQYHYLYEGGCGPNEIPDGTPIVVYPYEYGDGVAFSVLLRGSRVAFAREEDFLSMMGAQRREER